MKTCYQEHLASNEYAQILICKQCGKVHLNLENLSLQIPVKAFLGLSETIKTAANKISVQNNAQKKPALTVVKPH